MLYLTCSEVADRIGCTPRNVTDAFYDRILDEKRIIRVGRNRAIPEDYLPEIRRILAERGKLRREPEPVA